MAWDDARIGYGRIGFLPIGGRDSASPDPSTLLTQGDFSIEVRTPEGELLAILHEAFKVGYEELLDGIGRAWASIDLTDSKWSHVAQGNIIVIRERSQRPKVFVIRSKEEISS